MSDEIERCIYCNKSYFTHCNNPMSCKKGFTLSETKISDEEVIAKNGGIKPEFLGDDGEQYAIKPQDDDKIYKYTKKERKKSKYQMQNILEWESFNESKIPQVFIDTAKEFNCEIKDTGDRYKVTATKSTDLTAFINSLESIMKINALIANISKDKLSTDFTKILVKQSGLNESANTEIETFNKAIKSKKYDEAAWYYHVEQTGDRRDKDETIYNGYKKIIKALSSQEKDKFNKALQDIDKDDIDPSGGRGLASHESEILEGIKAGDRVEVVHAPGDLGKYFNGKTGRAQETEDKQIRVLFDEPIILPHDKDHPVKSDLFDKKLLKKLKEVDEAININDFRDLTKREQVQAIATFLNKKNPKFKFHSSGSHIIVVDPSNDNEELKANELKKFLNVISNTFGVDAMIGDGDDGMDAIVFESKVLEAKHTIKRKYTEHYPAKHVYANADKRNKVLSFVESKGGSVTETEMKEFLSQVQEDSDVSISKAWLVVNRHLVSAKKDKAGIKTFTLTNEGVRVLKAIKSGKGEVSEEGGDAATLDNTSGMGGVVPPSTTTTGSGDDFVGATPKKKRTKQDEEEEDEEEPIEEASSKDMTPEIKKELRTIATKAKGWVGSKGKTNVEEVKISVAAPYTIGILTETPADAKFRYSLVKDIFGDVDVNKNNASYSGGGSAINQDRIQLTIPQWKKAMGMLKESVEINEALNVDGFVSTVKSFLKLTTEQMEVIKDDKFIEIKVDIDHVTAEQLDKLEARLTKLFPKYGVEISLVGEGANQVARIFATI